MCLFPAPPPPPAVAVAEVQLPATGCPATDVPRRPYVQPWPERVLPPLGWLVHHATLGVLTPFYCFGDPVGTTALILGRLKQRVRIFELRKDRLPETLCEAYGDARIPVDAWGNPAVYRVPGTDGAPYDLISVGPDAVLGTIDDVDFADWR